MEIFDVTWNRHDAFETIYVIGFLVYNNNWLFKYNLDNVTEAIKMGFRPFEEFPFIDEVYTNASLFCTFMIFALIRM